MDKNTWLNIYQAYSLEKISSLNKHGLAMQYAQCEQLIKLNKELAATNATTRRILQNQIREIEKREEQKYYKSLSFNINLALQKIENQDNISYKMFLSNIFLKVLHTLSKQAMQILEEISDKEYASKLQKRIEELQNQLAKVSNVYQNSYWYRIDILQQQIKELSIAENCKNYEAEIKEIEETYQKGLESNKFEKSFSKGCFFIAIGITAFFLLVFLSVLFSDKSGSDAIQGGIICLCLCGGFIWLTNYWVKKYSAKVVNKDDSRINFLENEITSLRSKEIELHKEFNNCLEQVYLEQPRWEEEIELIRSYLPSDKH